MSIVLDRVTCFPAYESPAFAKAADDDVASCSSSIGRNSDCHGGSDDGDEAESSLKGPLDTMDALEDSLPIRYESPAFAKAADDDVASCSSSIGRNSDCHVGSDDGDEAESSLKGPLDTMDDLEDSLPIRRGISKFYRGKSKSFTSLEEALPSSSAKDLAKPENCYSRKRKNVISFNLWKKPVRSSNTSHGDIAVSKRPTNSSRRTQGLAPCTSSSSKNNSYSYWDGNNEEYYSQSQKLPPLHPHGKAIPQICSSAPTQHFSFPTRSFSLADLEGRGELGPIS